MEFLGEGRLPLPPTRGGLGSEAPAAVDFGAF